MTERLPDLDYLSHLRTDGGRLADLVETGPLDARIAVCPGWDLRQLGVHMGTIHRWVVASIDEGAAPRAVGEPPSTEAPALANWMRESLAALLARLEALDADASTWHPFPVPQLGRVWPRRQAHETMIHRWDGEHALGRTTEIDGSMASDGIDEYFEVMLPRLLVRTRTTPPAGTLHVHCTDVAGEWLVRAEDGSLVMTREHAKGDAALRGPAEALLLRLWGRPTAEDAVDAIGDPEVAANWLALGGA